MTLRSRTFWGRGNYEEKNPRKIFALAFAAVLAVSLCACSSVSGASSQAKSTSVTQSGCMSIDGIFETLQTGLSKLDTDEVLEGYVVLTYDSNGATVEVPWS